MERNSSFLNSRGHYCAARPARLFLEIVALLPLALLLALRSWKSAGSALLWGMTVGASTRSFASALTRYARRTLPGYSNDAIFAELARHIQAGSRVVVATGDDAAHRARTAERSKFGPASDRRLTRASELGWPRR